LDFGTNTAEIINKPQTWLKKINSKSFNQFYDAIKNNAYFRLALLRYQEKAVVNPFENTGAYAADN